MSKQPKSAIDARLISLFIVPFFWVTSCTSGVPTISPTPEQAVTCPEYMIVEDIVPLFQKNTELESVLAWISRQYAVQPNVIRREDAEGEVSWQHEGNLYTMFFRNGLPIRTHIFLGDEPIKLQTVIRCFGVPQYYRGVFGPHIHEAGLSFSIFYLEKGLRWSTAAFVDVKTPPAITPDTKMSELEIFESGITTKDIANKFVDYPGLFGSLMFDDLLEWPDSLQAIHILSCFDNLDLCSIVPIESIPTINLPGLPKGN